MNPAGSNNPLLPLPGYCESTERLRDSAYTAGLQRVEPATLRELEVAAATKEWAKDPGDGVRWKEAAFAQVCSTVTHQPSEQGTTVRRPLSTFMAESLSFSSCLTPPFRDPIVCVA
ncbi:hypothetical protein llap_14440 [Limosa lapponica baueri]|uniref:Uncharacterized protein n=1 Tax=Limosa lapponica baueri TaxID=1758121 RepID=A0A2I0TN67_LIMLA|nr:hypothetical protein llap_14440 [Limosa lapponica baueri]